ncbi:MAG: hypothetical protein ACYTFM_03585, partial [Planctomycetota bacterium]
MKQSKNKKKGLLFIIVLLTGFMIAVIAGSMGYVFITSKQLRDAHAPLAEAAIRIKVEVTAAHLGLEEIIAG